MKGTISPENDGEGIPSDGTLPPADFTRPQSEDMLAALCLIGRSRETKEGVYTPYFTAQEMHNIANATLRFLKSEMRPEVDALNDLRKAHLAVVALYAEHGEPVRDWSHWDALIEARDIALNTFFGTPDGFTGP